jgi:uncharacterized protein
VHLRQRVLLVGVCLFVCHITCAAAPSPANVTSSVTTLRWEDLVPELDRTGIIATAPPPVHDYLSGESGPAAQQPLNFAVNTALNGRSVRLPGFMVPLDLDPLGHVSEFLLVPYIGACIHVPPPPPNQVIYVTLKTHLAVASPYSAFWVTGRIEVSTTHSAMAITAYTIRADDVEPYEKPGQPTAGAVAP